MKTILFSFPGSESISENILKNLNAEKGEFVCRSFPDGETYLQLNSEVKSKKVVILCSLYQPNEKILPIYFLSKEIKKEGASSVCLVTPYLPYMRQDNKFKDGEIITSHLFAKLLSETVDSLITIDPHLHRINSLSEIYSIPTKTLHATSIITKWIKENISNPVLVGPDSESKQWVADIAKKANAPFLILEKVRHGDKDVEVSVPHVEQYKSHTPVLVDDIISTARTMIKTVKHLNAAGMKPTVCIGVHALFSEDAYQKLSESGIDKVVTCNTVLHSTNQIDLSDLIVESLND